MNRAGHLPVNNTTNKRSRGWSFLPRNYHKESKMIEKSIQPDGINYLILYQFICAGKGVICVGVTFSTCHGIY